MTIQTRTDVPLMSYPPPVRKPIYNTNLAHSALIKDV